MRYATRFISDGQLSIDISHIENQIRLVAIGRNNWLFGVPCVRGSAGLRQ